MSGSRWKRIVNFIKWLPEAPFVIGGVLLGLIALPFVDRQRRKEERERESK